MNELLKDVISDPVFALCALGAIGGGLQVVLRRSPVYAALGLMTAFLSVAVIFIKLCAPFLAAMHVLVYTGAILVLFLFVIMLLNLGPHELGREHPPWLKAALAGLCVLLLAGLSLAVFRTPAPVALAAKIDVSVAGQKLDNPVAWGGVEHVGAELFERWVLPFELVSLLIIVAILGAVVLAKKKLVSES